MFEKNPYTPSMRDVLRLSNNEAGRLGHDFIGPEHYMLGLIRMHQCVAINALRNLQVDLEALRRDIERQMEKGKGPTIGLLMPNDQAKRILEQSHVVAQKMDHGWVGTEHLLLGILREENCLPARCLQNYGVDFEKARNEVIGQIENHAPSGGAPKEGEAGKPSPKGEEKSKTPALDTFARDLTELAKENKLDPVIGREAEMERILQILCRRTKNNPILLGESGVGKTAIVEGLAQKINANDIPELLANKRLLSLDLAAIVAGTKYRGQFEERLKQIMLEIRRSQDVLIFIDEIHTLVGAGAAEGAIDASSMLKPALSRGEVQCIGATTMEEYRKFIEKDGALERRFQSITVDPPNQDEAIDILRGLQARYEDHHNVQITDSALRTAVFLSSRYISDRSLPDKAIDLVDEAGSRARLMASVKPPNIRELEGRIQEYEEELRELTRKQEFEECARLKVQRDSTRDQLEQAIQHWRSQMHSTENRQIIREDDIAEVVSKWTGIPVMRLEEKEASRLMRMEEELSRRVVSQEEAIKAISRAIRRSRSGLKDPTRPTGSFVFLGPTGVGKTELAKALAEFLFGDEDALIRVDMSEYMEKFSVSRLVGAPPGYVGYEEGGQLSEKVRRKPYSVVLLDEIEKAHPDVFSILLQVLDEGRLTDSWGHHVDFRNTVLILTSNIGTKMLKKQSMGFGQQDLMMDYEKVKSQVLSQMKKTFNPEFINRFDETLVFKALTEDNIRNIVSILMRRLNERLAEQNIRLCLSEEVTDFLAQTGYDSEYGARPLRRALQQHIEDPLSVLLLEGKVQENSVLEAVLDPEGKVAFENRPNDFGEEPEGDAKAGVGSGASSDASK